MDNLAESPAEEVGLSTDTEDVGTARDGGTPEPNGKKKRHYRELENYQEAVLGLLSEGLHQAEIIRRIRDLGYKGSKTTAEYYIKDVREECNITIPKRTSRKAPKPAGIMVNGKDMSEKELMGHIWEGKKFSAEERENLYANHPALLETEYFVRMFKKVFSEKKMPLLYLMIEDYIKSPIKKLSRFVKGLKADIEAVENAVASDKSNGFVEGTNSRIKMIKRTMYGRCSMELLLAKLVFGKWEKT